VTTALDLAAITAPDTIPAPEGAVRVRPGGLLASVRRPCPEHGGEGLCVARMPEKGCLVFWCRPGAHHFSAR
jgi:hypothetical protein